MDAFFSTLAVLVFISAMAIFTFKKDTLLELIRTWQQPQLSVQTVHSTILRGIKRLNHLEILEIPFHSSANFSDNRKIFGFNVPRSERKITILYSGYAVCGCELDKIRIANDFFNRNHISITVPNSKILHVVPNMDSFEVYQDTKIFSKKIDFELQMNTVNADLNAVKIRLADEAVENTNREVRKYLTELMTPLGIVAEISFTDNIESFPPPNSTRLLQ